MIGTCETCQARKRNRNLVPNQKDVSKKACVMGPVECGRAEHGSEAGLIRGEVWTAGLMMDNGSPGRLPYCAEATAKEVKQQPPVGGTEALGMLVPDFRPACLPLGPSPETAQKERLGPTDGR